MNKEHTLVAITYKTKRGAHVTKFVYGADALEHKIRSLFSRQILAEAYRTTQGGNRINCGAVYRGVDRTWQWYCE
jgi:hypothetical protein